MLIRYTTMKGYLSTIILVCTIVLQVTSQTIQPSGDSIGPLSKQWALSINPLILFTKNQFQLSDISQQLTARYFKSSREAIRLGLSIGFDRDQYTFTTVNRTASSSTLISFPSPIATTENHWAKQSLVLGLTYGRESRSAPARIQGIWGWETTVQWSKTTEQFLYGNILNVSPTAPVYVDTTSDAMRNSEWGEAANVALMPIQGVTGYSRILNRSLGSQFTLGGRIFAGVDYFIRPQFSLGAELGWGTLLVWQARGYSTWQSIGQSNTQGSSELKTGTTVIDDEGFFKIRTNTMGSFNYKGFNGILRLTVYFNSKSKST
jgi:hypothetical protein